MGRRKLHKTPEQIAEQKLRWWGPCRNERRRQQYAKDHSYRRTVHIRNRDSYRRRVGSQPRNCRANIARIAEFGSISLVTLNGSTRRMRTFSVAELANALGYHRIVLYRWHKQGKFPRPLLQANNQMVYTFGQAQKILTIMSEHQDNKSYFHKSDRETIRRLFRAMTSNEA